MRDKVDITDPEWLEQLPAMPEGFPRRWERLWREAWRLHQRSCRPPLGMLDDVWETVGAGYFMPAFGHWDIVHSILDVLHYDADFAARQVRLIVKTLRDSDGRLPGLVREFKAEDGPRVSEPDYDYSPPPLWPVAAVSVFERTKDVAFLRMAYDGAVKGLGWWEANRRLPEGLFWFADCVGNRKWESGYDACPRWDGLENNVDPLACVDLSAQMSLYYQALEAMASALGEGKMTSEWRQREGDLAELVRAALWHEQDGLFYDRHPKTGRWIRVKTVACFWPMVAGQATSAQAERLVEHLADAEEFFTEVPVPSVALSDPTFSLDCWRGPTWLSQTHWVIRGLQRYGYHDQAHQIAFRALEGACKVLAKHDTIFEFFHPCGGPVSDLSRKGDSTGPRPDYIGHNPIHAIALSLLASDLHRSCQAR